jgi:cytochrome c2
MDGKEIRLIRGTLALLVGYVCITVLYRTLAPRIFPPSPQEIALVREGQGLVDICSGCHYLDQRVNFVGPHLVGLIGRPVADSSQYDYSGSLKQAGGTWTPDRLAEFLTKPQSFAPGTKMAVKGWSPDEAKAIVAYFQSKD